MKKYIKGKSRTASGEEQRRRGAEFGPPLLPYPMRPAGRDVWKKPTCEHCKGELKLICRVSVSQEIMHIYYKLQRNQQIEVFEFGMEEWATERNRLSVNDNDAYVVAPESGI